MRRGWWLLGSWLALGAFACARGPVSFPDRDKVALAQQGWCAALAKYEPEEGRSWQHGEECEAAYPTSSAEFLAQMTGCYTRLQEEGSAPDLGGLVHACTDEVLAAADPGDLGQTALVQARCRRMERCEKVAVPECLAAFDSLNGMQKAALTTMYNLRAQHRIAECLSDSDCSDDEDAAREACYAKPSDERIWLPL